VRIGVRGWRLDQAVEATRETNETSSKEGNRLQIEAILEAETVHRHAVRRSREVIVRREEIASLQGKLVVERAVSMGRRANEEGDHQRASSTRG
jgi:hypothetical protein